MFWAPIPRLLSLYRLSLAGTLEGVQAPANRVATVTPYVIGSTRQSGTPMRTTNKQDVGVDAKLGLTQSLTLDMLQHLELTRAEPQGANEPDPDAQDGEEETEDEEDDESGEEFVTPEALAEVVDDDTALVTLSVVQYRSGALHDVRLLTRMAHDADALVVWDASHAVGVVDMQFDADDVDLAVGCTYKYGNSGPGSPAWLYVNERLQRSLRVPIQGWFAQRDQFAMGQGFDRADGMRGFQIASPSIVGMRCIEAAFGMIGEAGLPAIAAKAALGTEMMVRLHDEWLAPLGFELVTPRDPARRGGHVTLRHPEAKQIATAMRELVKVIPDYREPSSIRLAMSPLATSFTEVWEGFDRIRRLVESKRYRDVTSAASRVT